MADLKEADVRRIVKEGIIEAFTTMGFPVHEPLEIQADLQHLRKQRKGCEAVRGNIIKTIITVSVPGALYMVWSAFKQELIK